MIVTVTPNTGLDRVIFVRDFSWGSTLRAEASAWGMGGKATDASLVLGELGEANIATGFAAGETGQRMVQMLQRHPITRCDFIWVEGETRVNYVLVDTARSVQSTITVAGLRVSEQNVLELLARFHVLIRNAACAIIGGSLPEGAPSDLHGRLIAEARQQGVPTILDASGDALRLGFEAGPTILKPNRDELSALVRLPIRSDVDVVAAARKLLGKETQLVVVTAGDRGAWAVREDGEYHVPALPIDVVNTAGAGDALAAGIAAGIARGWPWQDGLRLGIAAAAAVCLTPGTAICCRADVEHLMKRVRLFPIPSGVDADLPD